MMKKLSERKKKWIERTVANDRSYKLFLYNRMYTFALLVLVQCVGWGLLLYLFVYNSAIAFALQITVGLLALIFILHIINKYDRPSSKMNWVLIILLAPVFGVPLYIVCGEGRPTREMKKKIEQAKQECDRQVQAFLQESETPTKDGENSGLSYYLTKYAAYPDFHDGEIAYYESGEKMFPVMKEELEKAEKFILLEYFIIAHGKMWGEILKILLKKAEEGVQVRVLYDDFGCITTLPPRYDKYLETLHENIRCLSFNNVVPLFALRMNNRDHRKLLVIDGKTAFTGGINLADEYIAEKRRFGYWKDSGVRITGNAVNSFTKMFFYIWNAFYKTKEDVQKYLNFDFNADMVCANNQKQIIQPYDDSPLDSMSVGEEVYLDIINRASKYVYIFTPYLILDDSMRVALCRAALRGVDVRIVTPAIPDKKTVYRLTRANYHILMKAGVRIYEYTPGFIHAKSMLSDDERAVVGTINLDYRSLYLHFENAVYFSNCSAIADLKRDCEETFAASRICTEKN